MYGSPRNATIIAKSAMQLYELHRDAFRYVMVGSAQSQLDQTVSHLKKVELLEAMNERDLVRLAEALEPVSFSDGQNIITEGDTTADYFYIIEAGTVVISSEGEEVVRRHAGEYFGELALLKNVPRIATVTAVDNVVLLQVILPTAPAASNEGGSSPLLALLPTVSWPWVPAWGSLEPCR